MEVNSNKITNLKDAVTKHVTPGCHLSIGGFTINRNPMAAVYEIIRQNIRDIHLYAHSNGQGMDELVGAGCVSCLEIAYGGTGKFMSTCIRFKKAAQEKTIKIEDYSNYQMTLRFLAGSMGIPFLPTRSSLGTDIINKWGFSKEFRQDNQKIPNQKLVELENPFDNWCDTERMVLVPAINPDVTIIHVQQADYRGNCKIDGLTFADIEQAKAAKVLIITCEDLLDDDYLKNNPDRNQIPFIHADAVIHIPFGAYPTACFGHYDYDPVYLKNYTRVAKNDDLYKGYIEETIFKNGTHMDLLDSVGRERLENILADKNRGYAKKLDRR
ncbi:CoA transferase subunit A [Desulfobacula toluolica]|uniref:GctA: Glutaconate CoA-transferase, subunit A n=1 Tax=Desulfobacula toluolica (strain DSM 7467 / Tol2) TaxID=651182 RepID=K0N2C3_DESTT|nr:CoA-transferase [Desulfobacula toluolica]CCK78294.1 GctA: Glutaconate CoA-transferase, subunit A [Desulfobacula toluolica Tol2]